MKVSSKVFCVVLALVLALSCIGCSDNSANNSSANQPDTSSDATSSHRELPNDNEADDYSDEDHLFDYNTISWSGPEGYKIVVPTKDSAAKKSAQKLQDYYRQTLNVNLQIVSESTEPTEKEILVGATNRDESGKNIAEADISVSVKGEKLVFGAGHSVTLDTAVNRFIRLAPKSGEAHTFALTTDFKSTLQDGYEYVWGDEFEDSSIDFTKWDYITKMEGNDVVQVSYDKDVVDVADGRLKLHAIHYFDNNDPTVRYKVPGSVITQNKMNYVYGYLEIRSRVPYSPGV
jgi:hypothetical protein